jgi:hypothetical protein
VLLSNKILLNLPSRLQITGRNKTLNPLRVGSSARGLFQKGARMIMHYHPTDQIEADSTRYPLT